RTPLSWAVGYGRPDLVELLLQNGANANSRAASGRTPLSYAVEQGDESVFRFLLHQKDVDPDSKSHFSQTPLFRAAIAGHSAIINLLLEHGADPDAGRATIYCLLTNQLSHIRQYLLTNLRYSGSQ
ncbi:ankyrin repeat-containing domain protein, partial [Lasiosphaeria miniovina]